MLAVALQAVLLLLVVLGPQQSIAACIPCEALPNNTFPVLDACCPPHSPTSEAVWNGNCVILNGFSYMDTACWDGAPPGDPNNFPDVIIIRSGHVTITPLTQDNYGTTVFHSLVVSSGANVTLQGYTPSWAFTGVLYIAGELHLTPNSVQGTPIAPEPRGVDAMGTVPHARLTDFSCYQHELQYFPAIDPPYYYGTDFYPRIECSGIIVIADGGAFHRYSGSTVFPHVQVQAGGAYRIHTNSFNYGRITNMGETTYDDNVVHHAEIYNTGTGVLRIPHDPIWGQSPTWYALQNPALTNKGQVYLNTNCLSGVFGPAYVLNLAGGVITQYTTFGGHGIDNAPAWTVDNHGTYIFEGDASPLEHKSHFGNFGKIIVNGSLVFLNAYEASGGSITLLNGGHLNFASSYFTGEEPSMTGTPLVHLEARGCVYGNHGACCDNTKECVPTTTPTPAGITDTCAHTGACYDAHCYPCDAARHEASHRHRAMQLREQLVHRLPRHDVLSLQAVRGFLPTRSPPGGARSGDVTNDVAQQRRLFRLDNTVIDGDGTGKVVSTVPVFVKNLALRNVSFFAVVEGGVSALRGGGTVHVEAGSSLYLGITTDLSEGGTVLAHPGGRVVVDAHCTVSVTNFTVVVRNGAALHVDGHLHAANGESLRTCGVTTGSGHLVLSLPSAKFLSSPTQC